MYHGTNFSRAFPTDFPHILSRKTQRTEERGLSRTMDADRTGNEQNTSGYLQDCTFEHQTILYSTEKWCQISLELDSGIRSDVSEQDIASVFARNSEFDMFSNLKMLFTFRDLQE